MSAQPIQAIRPFKFTAKQTEALSVVASDATHCMLFGGSRSGKTFLHVRNLVARAIKAPGSRHLIARYRFNAVKQSIGLETMPAVMSKCFPQVPYTLDKSDWYFKLPNGSEIWLGGVDEKERVEKVLGKEYVTILLNECSQIPWESCETLMTRLAQLVMQTIDGKPPVPLKPRAFYDCNPPGKGHWTFKVFKQKVDPTTKEPLRAPENYVAFQMNPKDNIENQSSGYLSHLEGLSARMRRRFLEGEFGDENPGALFDEADIDKWRVVDGEFPQFVRVVVAVDPSGSGDEDNADNDEIGISVAALGTDGNAYVLEDATIKAGPATWANVAVTAYDRHQADCVVGETNFGGDMVRFTVQTIRPRIPFKKVTASRGKAVRAEPFSALYEQGKVRHVGIFSKLEDELCAMSVTGYTGSGSPNRADALIWALTELFPSLVAPPRHPRKPRPENVGHAGWQG